jgi:hypothetical protein
MDDLFGSEESNEPVRASVGYTAEDFGRSPPATVAEIQENVWKYSREQNPGHESDLTAQCVEGTFTGRALAIRESRGRKKVTQIVKGYSAVEQEGMELKKTAALREINNERTAELEKCYSAMRYRKYLFKNRFPVPPFIDNCDFQKLREERRVEKGKDRVRKVTDPGSLESMSIIGAGVARSMSARSSIDGIPKAAADQ